MSDSWPQKVSFSAFRTSARCAASSSRLSCPNLTTNCDAIKARCACSGRCSVCTHGLLFLSEKHLGDCVTEPYVNQDTGLWENQPNTSVDPACQNIYMHTKEGMLVSSSRTSCVIIYSQTHCSCVDRCAAETVQRNGPFCFAGCRQFHGSYENCGDTLSVACGDSMLTVLWCRRCRSIAMPTQHMEIV